MRLEGAQQQISSTPHNISKAVVSDIAILTTAFYPVISLNIGCTLHIITAIMPIATYDSQATATSTLLTSARVG